MEKSQKGSNFYMLTAQILNDKNLNHAEKLTMAILNGLAFEDGSCYPSNEWLADKLAIKERAVRDILENLEKNNYIKRELISCENNPFKKYRIIYINTNFKLCLPEAENCHVGAAENCHSERQKTAGIIDKKKTIDKKEIMSAPPSPSAEASDLCKFFLEKIRKRNPNFKDPKIDKWEKEFDQILTLDKRTPQELKTIIEWVHTHSFWKANILAPTSLRKHYDKLLMQMGAEADQFLEDKNRKWAIAQKKKYSEQLKSLTISPKYAINLGTSKEIPFSLPESTFKPAFFNMFGGKYVPGRDSDMDSTE